MKTTNNSKSFEKRVENHIEISIKKLLLKFKNKVSITINTSKLIKRILDIFLSTLIYL